MAAGKPTDNSFATQGAVGTAVSSKPVHVIFDCVVPLSSLIKPTVQTDHKICNT